MKNKATQTSKWDAVRGGEGTSTENVFTILGSPKYHAFGIETETLVSSGTPRTPNLKNTANASTHAYLTANQQQGLPKKNVVFLISQN